MVLQFDLAKIYFLRAQKHLTDKYPFLLKNAVKKTGCCGYSNIAATPDIDYIVEEVKKMPENKFCEFLNDCGGYKAIVAILKDGQRFERTCQL